MFSLSFLNTGFLIAGLAALIPLLIYFFAKKRPQQVIFSSIRFITQSQKEKKSKINLINILLLIIRIMIILLVCLAFARPLISGFGSVSSNYHAPTSLSIIADNSISMDFYEDEESNLDKLKDILKEINNELEADDFIRIYTKDHNLLASKFHNGSLSDSLLSSIKVSFDTVPIDSLISQAKKDFKESKTVNNRIILISDFNEPISKLDSLVDILSIPIYNREKWKNLSCSTNEASIVTRKGNKFLDLTYSVHNHCLKAFKDQLVRVKLNDRKIDKFISIEGNKTIEDHFSIQLENSGWQKGYIEIQDEELTFDNRYYFSFYYSLAPKIAVVTESQLALPYKTMLEIFAGNTSNISYLNPDLVNNNLIKDFDVIVFNKLTSISSNIDAAIDYLNERDKGFLWLVANNKGLSETQFFKKEKIEILSDKLLQLSPNKVNIYDEILQNVSKESMHNLYFNDVIDARIAEQSNNLLSNENRPILYKKDKRFYMFFGENNDFVIDSSYPVIFNKILESLSESKIQISSESVLSQIDASNIKKINDIDVTSTYYQYEQTGIYKLLLNNGSIKYIAVNLQDKHFEESKANSNINNEEISKTKDWRNDIFSDSNNFEIVKYILIALVTLLIFELLLVKIGENRK